MKKAIVATALSAAILSGGVTASATTMKAGFEPAQVVAPTAPNMSNYGVPDSIKVPAGSELVGNFKAAGVQIYGCVNATWTFIQPAANLTNLGWSMAVHFAGPANPRWESTKDGSLVGAVKVASVDQPGSIPQLLLRAVENTGGTGTQFGAVSYVQRLNTAGGAAPASSCANGSQIGVQYTAEYKFWANH
ncbi:DUF3455 domain-containing protein [Amycolatopsis sp. cg5]|uniref:DUF3455 domain-containing protein n=1 Tax=Amycolatopsis sp. cg5 TaxID=3238802 RepID=UPI003526C2B5